MRGPIRRRGGQTPRAARNSNQFAWPKSPFSAGSEEDTALSSLSFLHLTAHMLLHKLLLAFSALAATALAAPNTGSPRVLPNVNDPRSCGATNTVDKQSETQMWVLGTARLPLGAELTTLTQRPSRRCSAGEAGERQAVGSSRFAPLPARTLALHSHL